MGGVGKALKKAFVDVPARATTLGMVDPGSKKVFSPKRTATFLNDALTVGTMGLVDAQKGRVAVPFSGASARQGAKAIAGSSADIAANLGMVEREKARATINEAIDSPKGRLAAQGAATLSALGTGYGAAGALGAGASGATVAAGGAGAAAQQLNQAEAEQYKIQSAEQAQRTLEEQKKAALKEAEDAALAVQTKQAEERRRRASKQAQTVLTGTSGLGGQTPSYAPTLSGGRRSVLG